ncbi:MAG: outer spore coat protein CotE [Bacilli bacterium]|nr:outer spore coat protein CotE [Mollicutes bacterium]MDY6072375.1 outer spore coat protein CotE [Bacilli bacterium]
MFNNYKEIVTKTVIGKGKKTFKNDYELTTDTDVDTVLGCWVINHKIHGKKDEEYIKINGSYDINIWYSYDNNTKTNVVSKKMFYEEKVRVKVRENGDLNDDSEIIIRSLKNPTCIDVSNEDKTIKYTISKELGIEIVGDAKIRIPVSNTEEDYDLIIDEDAVNDEIEKNVNINYLDNKDS